MSSTLANHYIRPEDLSPLPTTLDAKNSPLALLAQTCSNIGADLLPASKRLIPPIEKSTRSPTVDQRAESVSSNHDKSVNSNKNNINCGSNNSGSNNGWINHGGSDSKISFKPYETNPTPPSSASSSSSSYGHRSNSVDVISDSNKSGHRHHHQHRHNNNNNNNSSSKSAPVVGLSRNQSPNSNGDSNNKTSINSNHNQQRPESRGSTQSGSVDKLTTSGSKSKSSSKSSESNENSSAINSTTNTTSSSGSSNGSTPLLYSSSGLSELSKSQLTPMSKSESVSSACKTATSLISGLNNGYNGTGFPHHLHPHHQALSPSGLLHSDRLKSSPLHYSSSLLSPYLNQAQAAAAAVNNMKAAAAAAAAAASVCRDPYCKGCQYSAAAAAGLAGCPTSMANSCLHSYPLVSTSSFFPPGFPPYISSQAGAGLVGGIGSSSVRPYVCNWTVAGAYCGQSFPTCEELFHHLKSHTSVSAGSPFSSLPGYYNGPPQAVSNLTSQLGATRVTPAHSSSLDSFRYRPYGKLGPVPGAPTVPSSLLPQLPASASHLTSLNGGNPLLGSYYPHMYN